MNDLDFAQRVLCAAEQAGIAPAEIAYSAADSFSVRVREQKLEAYEVSNAVSVTLRGRFGGRIGSASTQALDEESIALLVRGVMDSAALIETDEQDDILPPDPAYDEVCSYAPALDEIPPQDKIALAFDIDRRLHEQDARITPDESVVSTSSSVFRLQNTLGLDLSHRSNVLVAYTSALAKEGSRAATDFQLRWGYDLSALNPQEMADTCAREALVKLTASRLPSGSYPVVIKNTAMADLLSTFCGIFSADNAQKGLSLLAGREGETIASACVTLTDDPLRPWGLASAPFDREGAATHKKHLIENGVLCTLLHNRKTAKKAGVQTTGNAAGGGRAGATNLFIEPGTVSLDTLLMQLHDGLYLTEVSGLHAGANAISGDFSLLSRGFEVKDGKIARPVEQITVAGNFYALLRDVQCIADDLYFEGSPIGSPSLRVGVLSIAGE